MKRPAAYTRRLFLLSLLLCFSSLAQARTQTFNALFFQNATGLGPYLMLHHSKGLYRGQFQVEEVIGYAYRPFQIFQGGARLQGVIDHALTAHFSGAYGIVDFLQVGVDLPYTIVNSFQDPNTIPGPGASNRASLGDLKLEVKWMLRDPYRHRIGFSVIPYGTAPIGHSRYYVADAHFTGGAKIAADVWLHRKFLLSLNAGYQGGEPVLLRNIDYTHRFLAGGGASFRATRQASIFTELHASTAFNKFFSDRSVTPAEVMAGGAYDIKSAGVTINGALGTCLTCGAGGARVRGLIGVSFRYLNDEFRRREAEDEQLHAALFSRQGITPQAYFELQEKCPGDKADYAPGRDDEACPKYYELHQVSDLYFQCPAPEQFDPGQDDPVCQKVFTLTEGSSQEEAMSVVTLSAVEMGKKCPQDPADFDPAVHDAGCLKYYDFVSAVEGDDPKYGELRAAIKALAIQGDEIRTAMPVSFDFDSILLQRHVMDALDEVVQVIEANPGIRRVQVEGHADSVGTEQVNLRISRARAKQAVKYVKALLTRADVELIPVGAGEGEPLLPNTTPENRERNRRVVFKILTSKP